MVVDPGGGIRSASRVRRSICEDNIIAQERKKLRVKSGPDNSIKHRKQTPDKDPTMRVRMRLPSPRLRIMATTMYTKKCRRFNSP